jgi:hypothetical protein
MGHASNRRPSAWTGLIGLVALMFGGCAAGSPTPPAASADALTAAPTVATPAAPTVAASSSSPEAILQVFDVGGKGWGMTTTGDALWIQVDPPVDSIVRVDATTGSTLATAPGGHKPKAGAAGLWVLGPDWLVRLDPASGAEILRVPLGGTFALAEDAVWLLNEEGLHRIDAESGAAADPISSDASAECLERKELVIAFSSAWVACAEGLVVRIDLETGDTTKILTGWGAHTFAVTKDAVWVTNYQIGTISRIDSQTNEVTSIEDAGSGVGITAGDGYIWAAAPRGIAKIDPETRSIVGMVDLGFGQYYELVWDAGVIWASTRGSKILKVDPTKLAP